MMKNHCTLKCEPSGTKCCKMLLLPSILSAARDVELPSGLNHPCFFSFQAFVENNSAIRWCPEAGCERAVRLSTQGPGTSTIDPLSFPLLRAPAVDCGKGHLFCWSVMTALQCSCNHHVILETFTLWFVQDCFSFSRFVICRCITVIVYKEVSSDFDLPFLYACQKVNILWYSRSPSVRNFPLSHI